MVAPPDLAERLLTIRPARTDDAHALVRLAALDCAPRPPEPLLIAEIDGAVRAALSLRTGAVIADPFHPTAAVVELLALRAVQLRGPELSRARRMLMRMTFRLSSADPDALTPLGA
jgi:hypothetical protein